MGEEASDEQLMERYRDGDAGAFDILYRRHKGGLFRYLLRLCKQQSVAEELFQDVWSNIIRSRERYQPSAKFTTFLYQVAHNRLIDHVRRSPHMALLPLDAADEEDDPPALQLAADPQGEPENQVERKRLAEQLISQIDALPALQREAFLLREEGGLSLEEIAQATGVSAETAKSRLRYAVAKLREGLRGLR
jgi:RNA polymerase sigma-70 factor (ECF subfamily)